MPQAGFDPPGEKWQLCLNIVVALPPKPPRLDFVIWLTVHSINGGLNKGPLNDQTNIKHLNTGL